jgi:hypothetical protein
MINISVSAASGGSGFGVHVVSDHPLNHLLHPDTAGSAFPNSHPFGVGLDVDTSALGTVPGPLTSLGDALSSIAPSFLHVGFNNAPLPDGLTITGTGVQFDTLGIVQGTAVDSTVVTLHNILSNTTK